MAKPNTPDTTPTPAAEPVAVADGSVTVDLGKAGKLTGGLVLNSVPGAVMSFAPGQQVTVVFTLADGRTVSIGVPGEFVK